MENAPASKPAAAEPKLSPFLKDLKAFAAESSKLAPAEAAKRGWRSSTDRSSPRRTRSTPASSS